VKHARFQSITSRYSNLRIALVGDFCLDRYLEIDPTKKEISLETSLPVHNVVHVRAQPGGAGTILNNLSALGVSTIYPVGFCGDDGEGFELHQALAGTRGIPLDYFLQTPLRRTFTYCKPLLMQPGKGPVELNRLDSKNWTPTPAKLQNHLAQAVAELSSRVDAIILLSQVDVPETGVITTAVLKAIDIIARQRPGLLVLADSRTSLRGYPPVCLKMNRAEFLALTGARTDVNLADLKKVASTLAAKQGRMVFITLAENGILGAEPGGTVAHFPCLPVRGEIDIVGAGDAVTANLTCALASGANLDEALELANTAGSIVIHKLGTTGTANVEELKKLAVR
jgi:rfaE bifunctional protein kinase chain/domain